MEYQIYTKKEITNKIYYPQKIEGNIFNGYDITGLEIGKIDLDDLPASKFHPLILEIPQSKMDELNEKGQTIFTVITTQTIVLTKQL
ncbi:hypothetical protein ACFO4P_09490 [Epilithonimonas pallida]|uniref:Phage protein n=1 Tax=Epilithonimonas pallida TaxID=373671 RepID=A0ABY1R2X7_9FLAO|nr:hypothetical protein [Epilithonimonas pallida]SMP93234.1 hypothetical protein SAMN05421679_104341 [Epilithonimonas pallida]